MSRFVKLLFGIVAFSIVAVAIAAVVVLVTLDPRTLVALATERVEAASGRKLAVRGPVDLSLWPRLAIVADDVVFGNAPWGSRPDMASVQRVEARIALRPLLRRQIEIEALRLVRPDVLVETGPEGRGNWVLSVLPPPSSGATGDPPAAVEIVVPPILARRMSVEQGRIAWRDGASGATAALAVDSLVLAADEATGTVDAAMEGHFRGERLLIEAKLASLAAPGTGPGPHPASIVLSFTGGRIALEGTLRTAAPWSVQGRLTAELESATGLAKPAAAPPSAVPALPSASAPARLSADVVAGPGRYVLNPLTLASAEQSLAGTLELRTDRPRPALQLDLHSPSIDLRRGQVLPAVLASLLGARTVDAAGRVRVDRLVTERGSPIERVDAQLALVNGRLTVDPLVFSAFGGPASARVVLDASPGRSPVVGLRASAKGIDGSRLARDLGAGIPLTGAPTTATIDLSGPAESIEGFRRAVEGYILVQVGAGTIGSSPAKGPIGEMLTAAVPDLGRGATRLRCAVARLVVRKGVATSQRGVAIETDKIDAVLSGTLDLATEALDLTVRPSLHPGVAVGLGHLVDVVRVRGTLSAPTVAVDSIDVARAVLAMSSASPEGGRSAAAHSPPGRGSADPKPCRTALDGGAPGRSAPPVRAPRPRGAVGSTPLSATR